MYEYEAAVVRVVDGDTVDVDVDVGFSITSRQRLRVLGIDTPELRSRDETERASAREATTATKDWLDSCGGKVRIRTSKADAFGRYLAEILDPATDQTLTDHLLLLGYEPYKRR